MVNCGLSGVIHYLDDFFIVACTKEEYQAKVDCILKLFQTIGDPVVQDKLEGPDLLLTYLYSD